MADDGHSDLLMSVTFKGKLNAEPGEGSSAFDPEDDLMAGMARRMAGALGGGADNRLFSEIKDITFGVGLEGDESAGKAPENEMHTAMKQAAKDDPDGPMGQMLKKVKSGQKFKNFMDYGEVTDSSGNSPYSAVFHEITIARNIDRLSVKLLDACFKQTPLKKIVVVKRKFTSSQKAYYGYVRWDFTDVLITGVDWDHDELITEKLKFVYRTLGVQYKPQKNDGTLDSALSVQYSVAVASG